MYFPNLFVIHVIYFIEFVIIVRLNERLCDNHEQICEMSCSCSVYVVVQFDSWFNLDFSLFFAMLIYDNEYKTKENPN